VVREVHTHTHTVLTVCRYSSVTTMWDQVPLSITLHLSRSSGGDRVPWYRSPTSYWDHQVVYLLSTYLPIGSYEEGEHKKYFETRFRPPKKGKNVCDGPYLVGQGLGMWYLSRFSRASTVSTRPTLYHGNMNRAVIAHICDAYDHVCFQHDPEGSPHATLSRFSRPLSMIDIYAQLAKLSLVLNDRQHDS